MAKNPLDIDWLGSQEEEFSVVPLPTAVPAQIKTNDELGVKDPLLTSTALPNILDQFDLSQYTVKLSLKRNNDPASKDERVIAQTSVTATQIDDITINTLSSGLAAGEVTFRLIQPGHVTLMDDINRFRKELELKPSVRPILFLEINFKGYTTDYEDNDGGGVPTTIVGPYLYKLFILEIDINITETGSEYNVKTMIHNFYAKTNAVSEIPTLTVTIGNNLKTACDKLKRSILEYNLREKLQYTVHDEYVFNLDHPSVSDLNLKEAPITQDPSVALDSTNDDNADASVQKIEGSEGIEIKDGNLTFQSGVKIDQFFLVMLSMIDDFKKYIARREDGTNPSSKATPEKTFIKWFRVLTDVEEIKDGFDYYRQEYARRYTFTLQIYDTARTDIGQPDEHPKDDQVVKRFTDIKERGLLRKAYYHIFTGRNDQIKQLDISFKAGATILNPPGLLQGSSIKSDLRTQLSNSPLPVENQESYINTYNLRLAAEKAVAAAAAPSVTAAPFLPGSEESNQQKQKLADKALSDYVTAALEQQEKTGQAFRLYTAEQAQELSLARHYIQSRNAPDYVQSGTYFGFSNTLFGFTAYQYHMAALNSTLSSVNLTLRGDPWYLGKKQWTGDEKTELTENRPTGVNSYSNPAEGCFYGDHTFFYLQFATPRVSMENYDDEDDDDGYWNFANKNGEISQSFSGIYMLMGATNKFSNGEYTCEILGTLMNELTVSKLSALAAAGDEAARQALADAQQEGGG